MPEVKITAWSDLKPGDVVVRQEPRSEHSVVGISWIVDRKITLPEKPGAVIRLPRVHTMPSAGWVYERGGNGAWYGTDGETYDEDGMQQLIAEWGDYEVIYEGWDK